MTEKSKSQVQRLTRGEVSERTGCNIETVRYYERIGLLQPPPRSEGGHRIYDQDHLKRLKFICRSRELGFTQKEVRELVELVDGGDYTCAGVEAITRAHLHDVRRKIADLRKVEKVLKDMASQCDGGLVPDCSVIDALFGVDASARD